MDPVDFRGWRPGGCARDRRRVRGARRTRRSAGRAHQRAGLLLVQRRGLRRGVRERRDLLQAVRGRPRRHRLRPRRLLQRRRRSRTIRLADVGSDLRGGSLHAAVRGWQRGVVAEWCVRVVRSGACGVRCCGWGVGVVGCAGVGVDLDVVLRWRIRSGVRERFGVLPRRRVGVLRDGAIRDHYFSLGRRGRCVGLSGGRAAVLGCDVVSAGVPVRVDPVDFHGWCPGGCACDRRRVRGSRRTRRSAGRAHQRAGLLLVQRRGLRRGVRERRDLLQAVRGRPRRHRLRPRRLLQRRRRSRTIRLADVGSDLRGGVCTQQFEGGPISSPG